ncbi:MAG TPA: hypothetical protein ENN03_01140 [bacterium]|nr:hypothetical protein [bacterium]
MKRLARIIVLSILLPASLRGASWNSWSLGISGQAAVPLTPSVFSDFWGAGAGGELDIRLHLTEAASLSVSYGLWMLPFDKNAFIEDINALDLLFPQAERDLAGGDMMVHVIAVRYSRKLVRLFGKLDLNMIAGTAYYWNSLKDLSLIINRDGTETDFCTDLSEESRGGWGFSGGMEGQWPIKKGLFIKAGFLGHYTLIGMENFSGKEEGNLSMISGNLGLRLSL